MTPKSRQILTVRLSRIQLRAVENVIAKALKDEQRGDWKRALYGARVSIQEARKETER